LETDVAVADAITVVANAACAATADAKTNENCMLHTENPENKQNFSSVGSRFLWC
jgi:hypothetical protein